MQLAYLDTLSGISGDMTLAALVDAGADAKVIEELLKTLSLPALKLEFSETNRGGFRALRLDVRHPPEHVHRHLSDVRTMIEASQLNARQRQLALRIFQRLGEAEAKVHGMSIEQVHFHEVGAVDSIADIVGIAIALDLLDVRRIIASPPATGCGTVRIAHGLVGVPAPATAELLRGIPIRSSNVEAELTTPTGAAVLSALCDGFGSIPAMQIQRIGYGAGHRELVEQANILRVFVGQSTSEPAHDEVCLLETNVDDVTGEQLGYAVERLWQAGALDVYTTPIGMKKNRPGTMLTVIGHPEHRERLENQIFQHTGSLGIRRQLVSRRKLHREIVKVDSSIGPARAKIAVQDNGQTRIAPEYEDCKRLALESGLSLDVVFALVNDAVKCSMQAPLNAPIPLADRSHHDHHHDHSHHDHSHHDHSHHDHSHHDHSHHDHSQEHNHHDSCDTEQA